jgi:predicted RNA polymerase sigma factor
MFAVCHPSISHESQICLSLRILCGFGIDEIASAFMTNKEVISKRIFRAKEKLREAKVAIEMPPLTEIEARLEPVLKTVYLLFNEGYYSVNQNNTLRKDLCLEAIRLCTMLIEHPETNKPKVNALLALMCFHASRFDARMNDNGSLILYDDQDSSLWNTDLISKGAYFLKMAGKGNDLSKYHLEAGIAAWHTQQADSREKWDGILHLYNQLLQREYSPITALNRTYAVAKVRGKAVAIAEAEKLQMPENHFYFALLGTLYTGLDDQKTMMHWQTALSLAKTESDKEAIRKKLAD